MSLVVDLVSREVCSLYCVYREAGKIILHTSDRKEYISYKDVVKELKHNPENNTVPDFLSMTGWGKPTLNSRLGDIIDFIKQNYPKVPVAIITNGTLLINPEVIRELKKQMLYLLHLDAANHKVFEHINGPRSNYAVKGLIKLKECFKGKIWLEVFILPGYNSHKKIVELKSIIKKNVPDAVLLNTLIVPDFWRIYREQQKENCNK